jgi:hypothetical protein
MPELADWAEEVLLRERITAETEDEIASDENLDDLERDLEYESEQRVRENLTSHNLKHRESYDPLTECALVSAPEPEGVSSRGICRPKKFISVHIKIPNDTKTFSLSGQQ